MVAKGDGKMEPKDLHREFGWRGVMLSLGNGGHFVTIYDTEGLESAKQVVFFEIDEIPQLIATEALPTDKRVHP